MRVLSAEDVRLALPMEAAIEAMRQAFAALAAGQVEMPPRAHLPVRAHDGMTLTMSASVAGEAEALAVEVVSVFGGNAARGLARIQAAVVVLDAATGRPAALVEGSALTAIRTGAASGLATDLLARPDSRTVAILGAGVQGRTQLQAICQVRTIQTVWVYDPVAGAAEALIAEMAGEGPVPRDLRIARDARQAVSAADIVCAATTAADPVFADGDVREGTHINAVGSFQPHVAEVPPETVRRAFVVVDCRQAALAEAGDLIRPIRQGLIGPDHIRAELGEVILGRAAGRQSPRQVTLFKSVGLAVQDAVAARAALDRAARVGRGVEVPW